MKRTLVTAWSRKSLFIFIGLFSLAPLFSLPQKAQAWVAPGALLLGTLVALTSGNPFAGRTRSVTKLLLQSSVVLLGLGMNLSEILKAGKSGLLFSLFSVSGIFLLGWLGQRKLGIRPIAGLLVTAGTAICGGSAIAAVSSVVSASDEDVSVSAGTVFLLNGVALLIFPALGHLFGLSQTQFGQWSGIAIHDIASVVGAGASYGPKALDVATAVKLSRVLFLIPASLLIAFFYNRGSSLSSKESRLKHVPWFVGGFLIASLARSGIPVVAAHSELIHRVAGAGFALSLYFIGSALTRSALRSIGVRPLILGVLLWFAISVSSLAAIRMG